MLGYDPVNERVLLFSGAGPDPTSGFNTFRAGTFLYGPVHTATVSTFGTGCAGSAGVPALGPLAGSRPWLGDTLHLALANLPSGGPSAALIGLSNQSWLGVPLPIDLTPLGMPRCSLWVSAEVFLLLVNNNGTAVLDLQVPNAPALLGATIYAQGLASDPSAKAFGVTTSNGCRAVIGGR